tara:strand:- start:51 stop:2345 length:2295 start_codon:yes stop_codon:yes gene_type:complete
MQEYAMGSINIGTVKKTSNEENTMQQKIPQSKSNSSPSMIATGVDNLLYCAEASLRVACLSALDEERCRYCWVEQEHCLCSLIHQNKQKNAGQKQKETKSSTPPSTPTSSVQPKPTPTFTVVCHPNECLRSTSSAKIAVQHMKQSKMLIYGASTHRRGISEAVRSCGDNNNKGDGTTLTYILFPEGPSERTYSVDEMMQQVQTNNNNTTDDNFNVNIVVPDGSWECCRSLVSEMERLSHSTIKYVTLNATQVATFHSPLIEALKKGQGLGRISTLEACALLFREMGDETASLALLQALVPLTNFVLEQKKKKTLSFKKPRHYSKWLEQIRRAADASETATADGEKEQITTIPIGLRRCTICCETLATPIRMKQHVKGKKHCELVFRNYLSSVQQTSSTLSFSPLLLSEQPTMDIALKLYQQWSVDVLATVSPEPPDVALVHLIRHLNQAQERKQVKEVAFAASEAHNKRIRMKSQKGDRLAAQKKLTARTSSVGAATTKGERLYRSGAQPVNVKSLPLLLRQESSLVFDTTLIDVRRAVVAFLARTGSAFGTFPSLPHVLEEFQPNVDVFRNFNARQMVYKAVSSDQELLDMYVALVETVVVPHLKKQLVRAEAEEEEKKTTNTSDETTTLLAEKKHTFYYQYPPTLRLQPGPNKQHGRTHRDAEYGHQRGELNFWMPVSYYSLTRTTLFVENSPGSKQFHPLALEYGKVGRFHGTLCHHYSPPNLSMCTRVSFDFRIGISGYFDPSWQLEGVKAQHGRREISM